MGGPLVVALGCDSHPHPRGPPYFIVRLQQSNRLFVWERALTPLQRKAWYIHMLLTQALAAKEVRLFALGPRLRQWFQDARSVLCQERIELGDAGRSLRRSPS